VLTGIASGNSQRALPMPLVIGSPAPAIIGLTTSG